MDRHLSVANCKGCIGSALGRRRSLHIAIVRSATTPLNIYIYIRYLYARNIRNISSTSLIKMNSLIKFVGNIDLSNFYFNFLKDNDVYFYSE